MIKKAPQCRCRVLHFPQDLSCMSLTRTGYPPPLPPPCFETASQRSGFRGLGIWHVAVLAWFGVVVFFKFRGKSWLASMYVGTAGIMVS